MPWRECSLTTLLTCATVLITWLTPADGVRSLQDEQLSADLADLRSKYSAAEIVRDTDHIRRDLSRVLHLAQLGELETEETTFYFMRMHDYDDNDKLDGLEMMQAFGHLMEHNNETADETKLLGMVDSLLSVDVNLDGFVSYPEWISYVRSARNVPPGHPESPQTQLPKQEDPKERYEAREATPHPHREQ
ncbi:hypothetical protein HPB47_008277 [Ixodes persulcatus]|uniref:Uncharacterized protein n=1 Tax=Ixodes persulcatus TaxID=34615 RepID=A0AC60P5A9_IXOPE|nr:hypothetical protein HPB47_008277 [Ixodes persulcatus]